MVKKKGWSVKWGRMKDKSGGKFGFSERRLRALRNLRDKGEGRMGVREMDQNRGRKERF
jgi:hypothetical protein